MKFKKPKLKIMLLIWLSILIIILTINLFLIETQEQQVDILYDNKKVDTNHNAQKIYEQMLKNNSQKEVLYIPDEEELVKEIELDEAHKKFLESNVTVHNFTK